MTRRLGAASPVVILLAAAVIAAGVAPVSGSASGPAVSSQTADDTAEYDAVLNSTGTYWQGQRLYFDATAILEDPGNVTDSERTFQIREVTEQDRIGDLAREFTVDTAGEAVVRTGSLDGRYVIQYRGSIVEVVDGAGYVSPPDGTVPTVESSVWGITRQRLDVELAEAQVYPGQQTTLRVSSNRVEPYTLAVSIGNLSFEQLESIFPPDTFAEAYDTQRGSDRILLQADDRTLIPFNTTAFTPGQTPVRAEVTDTTSVAAPTLRVLDPSPNARITAYERSENVGDLLGFTVSCSNPPCYVVIGDETEGIIDLVRVNREQTSIQMNTRYAGLDRGGGGVSGDVQSYVTDPDTAAVALRSSTDLGNGFTLGRIRGDLGLSPTGRERPLPPGTYTVRVATSPDIIDLPPPSDGELVVRDLTDAKTIFLTERAVRSFRPLVLPPGVVSTTAPSELADATASDGTVAIGDRLLLRLNATGLFGYLAARDTTVSALTENAGEGIDITLESTDGNRVVLPRPGTRVYSNASADRISVLLDTRNLRAQRPIRPGETYRAEFVLRAIDGDQSAYNVRGDPPAYRGYPYLDPGAVERYTTEITFVEPTASVTGLSDGTLPIEAAPSVTISGTTTVAPGSTLTVEIEATNAQWVKTADVTVDANRTWLTVLDFTNTNAGDEFRISITRGNRRLGTVDGTVIERSASTAGPSTGTRTDTANPNTATTGAGTGAMTTTAPQVNNDRGFIGTLSGFLTDAFSGLVTLGGLLLDTLGGLLTYRNIAVLVVLIVSVLIVVILRVMSSR